MQIEVKLTSEALLFRIGNSEHRLIIHDEYLLKELHFMPRYVGPNASLLQPSQTDKRMVTVILIVTAE